MGIILALLGLILFALYDAGTVWGRSGMIWKNLFRAGSVLWVGALIRALIRGFKAFTALRALFFLPCAVFLLLTVYAIFFAIPFNGTVLRGEQKVYTGGVYSLCRHPGVTFLVIALAFLVAALPTRDVIVTAVAVGTGDVLYALLQDVWTFPKTLSGYDAYKEHSRFLLIDPRGIGRVIKGLKRDKHES